MTDSAHNPTAISRREFVQKSALAVGVLAAPMIVPSRLFGATAPSNRIRVGHIGCGRIGQTHDFPGIANSDLAEVLAVCDLDTRRAESGKKRVGALYANKDWARPDVAVYADYHELLERKDIDAVSISLPDHQHAQVALTALMAGKD